MSFLVLTTLATLLAPADAPPLPEGDVVFKALVDELDRAVSDLKLEDLSRPYFVQMHAQDREVHSMQASYGGLVQSQPQRNRIISTRVRVGSYQLDNTNVPGSSGQVGFLPLDDDYTALRHAIWLLLDQDYKRAVETLTRKEAYLRAKTTDEDRPEDFTPAPPTVDFESIGRLEIDAAQWEKVVVQLSDRFHEYPKLQDSNVSLLAGSAVHWIVNSDGTRLRTSDTGFMLEVSAELQAKDGMPLADSLTYVGLTDEHIPSPEKISADLDEMARKLIALSEAPVLEQYTGPVLFAPKASGAVFDALLADGLSARPVPLGARWGDDSLEKKIGLRILPRTFSVYDDPGPEFLDGQALAGAYKYDDEGVAARRVQLVEKGILQTLVAGRAPTKKIKQTTGHARSGGFGDPRAQIGCLYLSDSSAISDDELKRELIQAAKDEGLPYGLRVEAMSRDREDSLPHPVYAYKVFVEDGREEMVRGMKFLPVQTRSLKRLLASGKEQAVYNSLSPVGTSIIAPGVLFEELELTKIEREFDKLPILPSPAMREEKSLGK